MYAFRPLKRSVSFICKELHAYSLCVCLRMRISSNVHSENSEKRYDLLPALERNRGMLYKLLHIYCECKVALFVLYQSLLLSVFWLSVRCYNPQSPRSLKVVTVYPLLWILCVCFSESLLIFSSLLRANWNYITDSFFEDLLTGPPFLGVSPSWNIHKYFNFYDVIFNTFLLHRLDLFAGCTCLRLKLPQLYTSYIGSFAKRLLTTSEDDCYISTFYANLQKLCIQCIDVQMYDHPRSFDALFLTWCWTLQCQNGAYKSNSQIRFPNKL